MDKDDSNENSASWISYCVQLGILFWKDGELDNNPIFRVSDPSLIFTCTFCQNRYHHIINIISSIYLYIRRFQRSFQTVSYTYYVSRYLCFYCMWDTRPFFHLDNRMIMLVDNNNNQQNFLTIKVEIQSRNFYVKSPSAESNSAIFTWKISACANMTILKSYQSIQHHQTSRRRSKSFSEVIDTNNASNDSHEITPLLLTARLNDLLRAPIDHGKKVW